MMWWLAVEQGWFQNKGFLGSPVECRCQPCHGYCYKRLASQTVDWIVMGERRWWCRQSFSELSKVKLNHSCVLSVTADCCFFSLPFFLLFFFTSLHSSRVCNSSAAGEDEDPHSVARHLYNFGLVCISWDSYAHTVWLHRAFPERIPKARMSVR